MILNPSPTFSRVTSAVVEMRSGLNPALPSPFESAMEKQPAWAAPISSSGFVPGAPSNRVLNE